MFGPFAFQTGRLLLYATYFFGGVVVGAVGIGHGILAANGRWRLCPRHCRGPRGYHPLVDAANWMAHRGAAYAILNIFRHPKTRGRFVILSGDVHYSFVYHVELRGHDRGPDIWQICSSGVRNAFPPRLLDVFDRANRWLYSPRSPLNWFTRRRRMRVTPRKTGRHTARPTPAQRKRNRARRA
jgi:hypothetical protein